MLLLQLLLYLHLQVASVWRKEVKYLGHSILHLFTFVKESLFAHLSVDKYKMANLTFPHMYMDKIFNIPEYIPCQIHLANGQIMIH